MRQSPLQQLLTPRGTRFESWDGALRPLGIDQQPAPGDLDMRDMSMLRKVTICGPAAAQALEQRFPIPSTFGEVCSTDDGGIVARVGETAYFVESGWSGEIVKSLMSAAQSPDEGVFVLPDERASFELCGHRVAELMQQCCALDLSQAFGTLYMTLVAGAICQVLPQMRSAQPRCRLWIDATYAEYLWLELETIRDSLITSK